MMIYSIPSEITEHVLSFCSPRDVASFAQTCNLSYSLIYRTPDQHLWRQIFLGFPFDDLRLSPIPLSHLDWKVELQNRIRAESALRHPERFLERDDVFTVEDAMAIVLRAIHNALPGGTTSDNIDWAERIITNSPLFTDSVSHTFPNISQSQTRARLLAYMGLIDCHHAKRSHALAQLRSQSRCYVYDLRHYTPETNYGVYRSKGTKDGSRLFEVNWIHARHCVNVVAMNIWDLISAPSFPPRGLQATRAYSAPGETNRAEYDWAGIEGIWRRYVCFMDYRDLFSFNFSTVTGYCDPSFFEDDGFREATRLIELELRLIGPNECPVSLHPIPADVDPTYPRLNFIGYSRGLGVHMALIKGHVDKHMDGTIRWAFLDKVSVYDQQTQWLFDGIQLGNVCSKAGVVGTWTGAAHEHDDPSGPSWIWKIAGNNRRLHGDNIEES